MMRDFFDYFGILAYLLIGFILLIVLILVDVSIGNLEFAGRGEIVSQSFTEGKTYSTIDSKGRVGVASSSDEFTIFIRDLSTSEIIKASVNRNTFFNHKEGDVVEWYRYHGCISGINYSNSVR